MKFKLNKAEYDGLSDELKKEYKLDGEEATLIVEGGEDTSALKRALDHEKDKHKTAAKRADEAEKREAKLKKDLAAAGGDAEKIKEIEANHAKELEKVRLERQAETDKLIAERDKGLIATEAQKIASKFTDQAQPLILPHIASRMKVEEIDGKTVVRVVDGEGGPSTASIADLEKEFIDNKDYSSIIKANVGSGGGATRTTPGGGATETKEFSKMNATEKVIFKKEHPEKYQAAVEAEKA